MDFSVGRLTHEPGMISIRRAVKVSEHEAIPFPGVDFPEPAEVGRELAASLAPDDFDVSDKVGSTAPGDNPYSRRQDIGSMPSLDSGTIQLNADKWDALQPAHGNGTELTFCDSGCTTSLESDAKNYHQVYGRSFPNLKYGLSWNAVDDQSQIMADYDHQFYLECEDHHLFRAPVGVLHRILDLGTGIGIWAEEMAAAYPSAEVVGTDLAPMQYGSQPNCRFEIENMNYKWARAPGSYDLVHGRGLLGNADNFHSLCTKAIAVLKPAGYLEMADRPLRFTRKDGTLDPNNVWFRVSQEVEQLSRMLDRPYDTTGPSGFRASMARAGFQTTYETRKTIPVTTCLETILDQIECALIMKLACEKVPDKQVKKYIKQLRRDLVSEAGAVCTEYVRVWGQKPCLQLIAGEINEYGLRVAMLRANSRFLRKAFGEISSKDGGVRASHYRRVTSGDDELRIPIEWVILCNDVRNSPFRVRFLLCLEFLGLISLGDYDGVEAGELLDKDEEQLLEKFGLALRVDLSVDERTNAYHRIALYRGLFEAVGGNEDTLQHCFDPSVSPIVNHEMCCDVFDIEGSNSFENIDKGRMCQALSRSKLLGGQALGAEDIMQFERLCKDVLGMDDSIEAEDSMDVDDGLDGWALVERNARQGSQSRPLGPVLGV